MKNLKIGDRVTIIGDHPWTDHSGIIELRAADDLWVVRLDNNITAGASTEQLLYQPTNEKNTMDIETG